MTESELQAKFIGFLTSKKGYGAENLLIEFKIGVLLIDLLIVNKSKGDLFEVNKSKPENLALIEFKSKGYYPEQSIEQINTYLNAISDTTIPSFLVSSSESNAQSFDVFIVTKYGLQPIDIENFPSLNILRNQLQNK
jgi:hypothetical protein